MTTLTLCRINRTSARIMRGTQVVGHVGLMAGGSCAFVNGATFGERFAFVAHATTVEGGLAELVKALTAAGLL